MCCSDGCAYLDDLDFFEPCIVPPPKHVQFGGQHFYGPSFHHHDHHHGHHGHKYSSDQEHFPLVKGGSERHTMSVTDMTDNRRANDRGTFYTISFPLRWKGYDLMQRLTSNPDTYAIVVDDPFGGDFYLAKDMDLKEVLHPCARIRIVPNQRSTTKHVDF
ncbi:uncharacterized protein G6M90_00g031750 [Metarhizium brunneum]|uniref:Uncharacterized protein n=1 Tax=Metarhizium brunneum TaxID=500148 RepID=A0A7D5UV11_9HYPO|nr:hypothetical protein G6M90_00g031750 [Metarhizium brunneum]